MRTYAINEEIKKIESDVISFDFLSDEWKILFRILLSMAKILMYISEIIATRR